MSLVNPKYLTHTLLLKDEKEIEKFIDNLADFSNLNDYIIIYRLSSPIYSTRYIKRIYQNNKYLYIKDNKNGKFTRKVPELIVILNGVGQLKTIMEEWPCFTIEKKYLYFIKKNNFSLEQFNDLSINKSLNDINIMEMIIENSENSEYYYDFILTIKNTPYNIINLLKVEKIINNWDPIGLLTRGSIDEYKDEVIEILNNFICDKSKFAKVIYEVFKKNFGETFSHTVIKCEEIAEIIIFEINNNK